VLFPAEERLSRDVARRRNHVAAPAWQAGMPQNSRLPCWRRMPQPADDNDPAGERRQTTSTEWRERTQRATDSRVSSADAHKTRVRYRNMFNEQDYVDTMVRRSAAQRRRAASEMPQAVLQTAVIECAVCRALSHARA